MLIAEKHTKGLPEFFEEPVVQLALPELEHSPSGSFEPFLHNLVTCPIASQLWPPKFLPYFGHSRQPTSWIGVLVLAAAVDHDGHALFAKDDVRATGQILAWSR